MSVTNKFEPGDIIITRQGKHPALVVRSDRDSSYMYIIWFTKDGMGPTLSGASLETWEKKEPAKFVVAGNIADTLEDLERRFKIGEFHVKT